MPRGKDVYCRYHCTGCDRHFTSLIAFDRHRKGRKCNKPRTVVNDDGKRMLGVQTNRGVCRYTRNPDGPGLIERLEDVTLWEAL